MITLAPAEGDVLSQLLVGTFAEAPPQYIDSPIKDGFCFVLEDFTSVHGATAYDAEGGELDRVIFT